MAAKNTVFLMLCAAIFAEVVFCQPSKKQINTDETKKTEERICINSTPCGWAVYNKNSRVVDYFMKNRCTCTPDTQCIRSEDDISINAFVYRCKSNKS